MFIFYVILMPFVKKNCLKSKSSFSEIPVHLHKSALLLGCLSLTPMLAGFAQSNRMTKKEEFCKMFAALLAPFSELCYNVCMGGQPNNGARSAICPRRRPGETPGV